MNRIPVKAKFEFNWINWDFRIIQHGKKPPSFEMVLIGSGMVLTLPFIDFYAVRAFTETVSNYAAEAEGTLNEWVDAQPGVF